MNIYSPQKDDEFVEGLKQFITENPLSKEEQKGQWIYSKEMHPMYGEKHTEETKKLMSQSRSGEKNPMFGIRGEDNPNYGRKRPDLVDINKSRTGRRVDESTKNKLSQQRIGELNPMFGKKHTEESKRKMSRFGSSNPMFSKKFKMKKITCPHCGKTGGQGGMKRYHFNNCNTKK